MSSANSTGEAEAPSSKPCSKCGEDKPLTEFSKKSTGKYGRRADCKPCRKKQQAERLAGTVCEVEGCDNQQSVRGLCATHYQKQRLAGTMCEVESCDNTQFASQLCRTHYEQQRFAGTVCEVEGCDNTQRADGLCRTHYNQQRLAGTVCEVEGCDNQQANRGLCNAHHLRQLKYDDPLGTGWGWDLDTRPTYVYCYVHDIEGLVKVGHGDDRRVALWRRQGWILLDSVVLPRKEARVLEEGTHQIWWDMGMKSEHALGSRRDGAKEMTEATDEAVQVALQRIAEAHKEILAAA